MTSITSEAQGFEDYINELTDKEQPTCNIENPDECEECGS